MEEEILKLMTKLDISREEALEILEDDKKIDKGEKLFELSKEQEKVAKNMRITTSVDAYGKKRTRIRKEKPDKQFLIDIVKTSLEKNNCSNIEVTNKEREIIFYYKDVKYKIVLSAPRS